MKPSLQWSSVPCFRCLNKDDTHLKYSDFAKPKKTNKQSDPDPVPISLERIFLYPLLIFFHGKAEIAQGSKQGRQQPGAESCLHHPGEEERGAHLQFHSPHWCTVSQLRCTAWDQGFQMIFHQCYHPLFISISCSGAGQPISEIFFCLTKLVLLCKSSEEIYVFTYSPNEPSLDAGQCLLLSVLFHRWWVFYFVLFYFLNTCKTTPDWFQFHAAQISPRKDR